MSAESTDSKGEDRVENVLDDILDGHNVDDDLATEIKEDAKPSTAIARPKIKVKQKSPRKKIKKETEPNPVVKEEVPEQTEDSILEEPVVEEPRKVKKEIVKVKDRAQSEPTLKTPLKKPITKKIVKKKKKEIQKEEPAIKQETVDQDFEDIGESSKEEILNLRTEEDIKPVVAEAMEAQEYDTRSEAEGSDRGLLNSDVEEEDENKDESDFFESGSERMSDAEEEMEEVEEDEEEEDEEEGEEGGSKKMLKRGISPIEWDVNSDEISEEEVEEEEEEEESPQEEKSENGSEKSEEEESKRTYPDGDYKLKYIFRNPRFFLIKSNNHENVALAKAKGVWSTPPQNEARLNQAYRNHDNVILIFSVKESGKFQGYARIADESTKDHPPIRWVLPPGLSARALSGVFKLDWINRRDLPFTKTQHLHNSWNDNKPVKIGRDGQVCRK